MISKYIGSKEFYKNITLVAIPLALTELLSSAMAIVDTIMVSSIGMVTAVGNATNVMQLSFMTGWGILSGIAAFAAQFYGAKQEDNLSKTFGISFIASTIMAVLFISAVYVKGDKLLLFFLKDEALMKYSLIYLKICVLSLIPLSFGWSASIVFRSIGKTKLTFTVSMIGGVLNVIANYTFIHLFKLGIAGAALGTLFSDFVMALIYFVVCLLIKPPFIKPIKVMFAFDKKFLFAIYRKTWPILLNETLFGFGDTLINKAFGMLGTQAMDAYYVAMETFSFFTFAIWGFGAAVSVVVGQKLGEGKIEQAKEESNYILSYALLLGIGQALLVCLFAPLILKVFNVSNPLTSMWTKQLLYVFAIKILFRTMNYVMFSTLKAGGDSKILNILDSGIKYAVGVTVSFLAVKYNVGNIVVVALIAQSEQIVRFFITVRRYKSGVWANDLTKLVI